MKKSNVFGKQPMTWRTSLTFVLLASFITLFVSWLNSIGLSPIHQMIEDSDAGLKFIQATIPLAITIELVLPTMAFVIWFKRPESRTIFGFYLLLLAIQIITERIVNRVWIPGLVIVNTLYAVFRVWQLWQGLQLIKTTQKQSPHKLVSGVLWLMLLFCSSSLIFLFTITWPSVL